MVAIINISAEAREAIKLKKQMRFRIQINDVIMDRVLTPISLNTPTLYTHMKEEYDASVIDNTHLDYLKIPAHQLTLIGKKEMPSATTSNDQLYILVRTLEKSGYIITNI